MSIPSRSLIFRLAYASLAAALGAFIGDRLEPPWHALVNGEDYKQKGRIDRLEGMRWVVATLKSPPVTRPASSPWWAVSGAVIGAVLGFFGRHWQLRGRVVAAVLSGAFGAALSALVALTSTAWADRREEPVSLALESAVVGGVLGLLIGILLGGRPSQQAPTGIAEARSS
jgi:hypothetical protein